jgi:phenylalanyl-tRNA synthetase beta chain
MANVKFPRKEFEKEIKLTKEVLEKIPLFGTPIESLTKEEIELEIFPNRPDLLSMQGFLRSFKDFIQKKSNQEYKILKPEKKFIVKVSPSVNSIRPYTACAIVKNLKFDNESIKSIIDLQEKIHSTLGRNRKKAAIGIYPLEKIKLPITYTSEKPEKIKFTPLESQREMTASQILTRHPTGKEYSKLLENLERYPIFKDASGKILSMPPIINSNETGRVSEDTKSVFVECSGSDFKTLNKILNIIVATLIDLGGKAYQMQINYKNKVLTPDFSKESIKISKENINKLLGLNLTEKQISKLLSKMGHEYSKRKVKIPAWRTDILHEVDIIEDIAIAYGYNNFIPNTSISSDSPALESKKSKVKKKISEILIGLGLQEISTYHLVKSIEASKTTIPVLDSKTDYKFLREDLLTPCLRILSENKDNTFPQKVFEQGIIFKSSNSQILEEESLILALTPGNFTEIKQSLDFLFSNLGLSYKINEASHSRLISGRTGEILLEGTPIGFIGEVHPKVLKSWNIKLPVSIAEISLEKIIKTFSNS